MSNNRQEFSWVGSQENFIDQPHTLQLGKVVIGRYGGNSSAGQYKNEDGCLVWIDEQQDWEFAMILDAHNTSESAELIIEQFAEEEPDLKRLLSLPANQQTFKRLEEKILSIFQAEEFLSSCREVTGETACLIVARKDKYVWWFSVGDCVLYLFHQDLTALGQYQVNQRQFYEWIGQVNTFDSQVPCYSTGIKELRKGKNRLFLTTDGLIECPNEPFTDPIRIYDSFSECKNDEKNILSMLEKIKNHNVRDSTTVLSWIVEVDKECTIPSDQ
ncbi:protein phosphatase 2C domain-containing protein [Bacillus sp. ISL-35]|uniref:protein phosphatase 2C domain-containing protein n=1 Tax=Bacillus sp. ISL-35 TaxID=2819122 RepID=UPI001BE9431E|nr:protein phosphatase 2C domain-containing protein [Bacillus sp. ISL-35]MBT2679323.1 protein phosphatase 2C domain-containing protein [Bacillus sp. ISL-35]MBT2703221.1 protein phosphatase 2C domain-containing protein [Chryseobacterium sp. ISL-80]